MALTWSPLHAALGIGQAPLTYGLVEQAVLEAVAEEGGLDWKRSLPGTGNEELDEFAKDVAAMANSGGGLVVYGVQEERGTGKAQRITPIDTSEGAQRRLRSLAATRIQPAVAGLEVIPLTNGGEAREGLIAVWVPSSADVPHTIGQRNRLGIPYRDGSDTRWMTERELERAYSDRFARRLSEDQRLEMLSAELSRRLDLEQGAWISGVGTPRIPGRGLLDNRSREEVTSLLQAALAQTHALAPPGSNQRYTLIRELDDAALNPRVGLRRWIAETRASNSPDDLCNNVYVEIHHDGTIGFAVATDGWYKRVIEHKHQVPISIVESFALDFVSLAGATIQQTSITTPVAVRVDLHGKSDRPFAGLDIHRIGNITVGELEQPSWSRTVRSFTPVLAEFGPKIDGNILCGCARSLALDVLNQFGFSVLRVIPS